MLQAILDAGGAIGIEHAKALLHCTQDTCPAGRNFKHIDPTDQLFATDLTMPKMRRRKQWRGIQVVYLTANTLRNANTNYVSF